MPKTANTKIRCSGYGSSKALYFPSLSSVTLSLPSPHTFYFRVWNLLIFAILKLERGKSVIVCLFSALSFSIIFALLLYLVIVQKKSLFPSSFLLKFWTYSVGWTWCSRNQNNRLVSSKATFYCLHVSPLISIFMFPWLLIYSKYGIIVWRMSLNIKIF